MAFLFLSFINLYHTYSLPCNEAGVAHTHPRLQQKLLVRKFHYSICKLLFIFIYSRKPCDIEKCRTRIT
jgi:hypothetical protein